MTLQRKHSLNGEEGKAFFDTINWQPLKRFLAVQYGIHSDLDIRFKVTTYGDADIAIRSKDDLKELCGILGCVLKSVHLELFTREFSQNILSWDEEKLREFEVSRNYNWTYDDIDAVLGPKKLWGTFDLRYETVDGGSNGLHLFSATYSEDNGWEFS